MASESEHVIDLGQNMYHLYRPAVFYQDPKVETLKIYLKIK